MRTMKHLAIAAIAASALALAGCGGGGSNSSVQAPGGGGGDTPATPTTPVALPGLPTDGNTYLDAADTTLKDGTISIEAGASKDMGAYTFSCSDAGPCEVTVEDGAITAATGEVDIAYTTAAKDAISAGKMAKTADGIKRARGVANALDDAYSATKMSVKISRKLGSAASITSSSYTAGAAPTSLGEAWAGATLTKTNTAVGPDSADKITVYTDIDAPKLTAMDTAYGANGAALAATGWPSASDYDAATDTLTIDSSSNAVELTKSIGARLDPKGFPKAAGADVKWTYVAAAPKAKQYLRSFDGTFHGAEGTYTCTPETDGSCTVTAKVDGSYEFGVGGTWKFEADTGAKAHIADSDYLQFGYWKRTPNTANAAGDYDYGMALIATGSDPFEITAVTALTGSATYSGSAVGIYTTKTVEDGVTTAANYGEFTADASLTAKFAGTVGGVTTANNTLTGKIDNFAGGTDMSDWVVELRAPTGADNIVASTGTDTTRAVASGVAVGELNDDTSSLSGGQWSAGLYGPTASGAYPSGVAGTFDVPFTNAHLTGAFGAKRK